MESIFYSSIDKNIDMLKQILPIGTSFDIIAREIYIGNTKAYFISINGMYNNEVMQMILSDLQNPVFNNESYNSIEDYRNFLEKKVSFGQVNIDGSVDVLIKNVLSGPSALLIDGFDKAILIDIRKYPNRSISEPENEKVLRGAKDGFVETLLFNANLIRRRIHNPNLTFEMFSVGTDSKTDVSVAYIGNIAKKELINKVRKAVDRVKADSLTLGSKSLEELLVKKRLFNPMPSFRVTERPDVACSYLNEGYVIIIVDTSPTVLIVPCNVFQFSQSPEDYYKNPITGNIFRMLRFLSIAISVYLLPVYMLINAYMPQIVDKISVLSGTSNDGAMNGVIQLLGYVIFAEFGLDMLEYSAAHIPENLITPVSIVGGVVVGEMAVNMNWFSEEVLFYAAITLLTTFVISNNEFSDSLRIYRIMLLVLTGIGGIYGFVIGSLLMLISIATTPTLTAESYIWPLYPFDGKSLLSMLFRKTMKHAQPDTRKREKTP